jgi:hypothetical protein
MQKFIYSYVLIVLEQHKPAKNPNYKYKPTFAQMDKWSSVPLEPKYLELKEKGELITRAYEYNLLADSTPIEEKAEGIIRRIQQIYQIDVTKFDVLHGEPAQILAEQIKAKDPDNFICANGKKFEHVQEF